MSAERAPGNQAQTDCRLFLERPEGAKLSIFLSMALLQKIF
jgi:hypothetical protein